jgi:hypothetical protein
MFSDDQETYSLKFLKLVKAVATRWLSHERASVRVIDRYVQLLDTLDKLYDERRSLKFMVYELDLQIKKKLLP